MKFGAYHCERGWVVDTGVGGTYAWDVEQAQWHDSVEAGIDELVATDIVDAVDASRFPDEPATAKSLEQGGWRFLRLL